MTIKKIEFEELVHVQSMAQGLRELAYELALAIKQIWEEIIVWQTQQRRLITGGGQARPLEGALELLDKV